MYFFFFCRLLSLSPVLSLLQRGSNKAEKFDFVSKLQHLHHVNYPRYLACYKYWFLFMCQMMDYLNKMAGGEYVGFSNATWVLNTTSLFLSNYTLLEVNLQFVIKYVPVITFSGDNKCLVIFKVSSQRKRPVTGTMRLAIISKRRKWVSVWSLSFS